MYLSLPAAGAKFLNALRQKKGKTVLLLPFPFTSPAAGKGEKKGGSL